MASHPATGGGGPPPAPSADDSLLDLSTLKAWIEQYEINPKPLTPAQRRCFGDLISSLKVEEPNLGTKDWISLLQRFRDAHQKGPGTSLKYVDGPNPASDKFTYTVILKLTSASDGIIFPNQDVGYVDSAPPTFGRKKDAKRYAAKCCVEWLMKYTFMPSDGQEVAFSLSSMQGQSVNDRLAAILRGSASPSTGPPITAQNTVPPGDGGSLSAQAADNNPSASQISLSGGAPLDDPDVQITEAGDRTDDPAVTINVNNSLPDLAASTKIKDLCRILGMGSPRYEITSVDKIRDLYDVRVDFGPDACRFPEGLGQARSVFSKRYAKEAVAEQVLAYLDGMLRNRQDQLKHIQGGSS